MNQYFKIPIKLPLTTFFENVNILGVRQPYVKFPILRSIARFQYHQIMNFRKEPYSAYFEICHRNLKLSLAGNLLYTHHHPLISIWYLSHVIWFQNYSPSYSISFHSKNLEYLWTAEDTKWINPLMAYPSPILPNWKFLIYDYSG